jgi:predicted aminopeptidase
VNAVKTLSLLLLSLLLVSCDSLQFYSQAIRGQLSIVSKRENIRSLVDDPATDASLRMQLETILEIRHFAETELGLPVNKNFSSYVNLERPFVVWNVFAAPEFSLESDNWCFPVAGCVSYRGYFSEAAAENFAGKLKTDGKDVYVGGVAAYSTLGWFADPVLNTVINRDEFRLAALIFHELAHQVVYIPGDTEFNEGFATAVELEGLRRWVEHGGSGENPSLTLNRVENAVRENQYRQEFVELVQGYRPQLEAVYADSISVNEKRRAKADLFDQLREDYAVKKEQWQGYDAYDGWFASEINNAKLNTVATYFNLVPAFDALLVSVDYSLSDFYEKVEEFSELAAVERNTVLAGMAQ